MMVFTTRERVSVTPPYRLDLTSHALRRLASNTVDVVAGDGALYRALRIDGESSIVRVAQLDDATLDVRASGPRAHRAIAIARRMLGVDVDLSDWMKRSARLPWLHDMARAFAGVRPPRYPDLWEACAHAIVFQQISIHAASAIMRRLVAALGDPWEIEPGTEIHTFPAPESLVEADESVLVDAGLSTNKRVHLRAAADAILTGDIDEAAIETLPTVDAAAELVRVRGIGPWSAQVVLLRGFGRLDAFPLRDSGVARLIKDLSGDPRIELDSVLEVLGPTRGMLYFHLLLGKLRNQILL